MLMEVQEAQLLSSSDLRWKENVELIENAELVK